MSNELYNAFDVIMNGLEVLMNELKRDDSSVQAKTVKLYYDSLDGIRDQLINRE